MTHMTQRPVQKTQIYYGAISFADELAGQEREVKLAALVGLNDYFKAGKLAPRDNGFWSHVEDFAEETDGLDTLSYEDILRIPIPANQKEGIERLGFRVEPVYAGTSARQVF